MTKFNKEKGSVTIQLDANVWNILNTVHEQTGINKSTQVENLIKDEVKNTDSILAHCEDELERIATEKMEEAERLLKIVDQTKAQRKQLEPYKTAISPTPKPKIKRANTNALVFTQDSVDGLRPQDKDVWFHDIQTKGLAIRSKKDGMTYYSRAKNEKLSRYTLKVKIADTRYMTLEKAKEVHAKNIKTILEDGINPNKVVPDLKNKGRHKNVATKETETKEASTTDWKLYSGIRYNSGLGLQILASLLNKNPDMKATCLSNYKNGSYRIRGERILDMFETDGMSIFEISRKEMITDGRGQHGVRHMSLQNTVLQVCKAIYHHGCEKDKAVVFAK
jgi:hypothetical protein